MTQLVKNPPAVQEIWVQSLGWEDPNQRMESLPTPVFWPGEFHGLYSPWDHKELENIGNYSKQRCIFLSQALGVEIKFSPHLSRFEFCYYIMTLRHHKLRASWLVLVVKNSPPNVGDTREVGLIPGLGRPPEGGKPTPVFWPGESHGQRSLADYSPWVRKESDMTEVIQHISTTNFKFSQRQNANSSLVSHPLLL